MPDTQEELAAIRLEEAKEKVLHAVSLLRMHPTQLLKLMREYSESERKEAMQELIFSGQIVLSNDRYLEIPVALTQ